MDLPNESAQLSAAWRALAGERKSEGWNTIPLDSRSGYKILAARHFPGNQEAILVGFRSVVMPSPEYIPQAKGFAVNTVASALVDKDHIWISLSRQPTGSQEIFTTMVSDVITTLRHLPGRSEQEVLALFLTRIQSWQRFMQRDTDAVLGPAAELGLVGELEFLRVLLDLHPDPLLALQAWRGPDDGLQDFVLGTGAIEVKATIADGGFPAVINSLDQLDEHLIQPLFIAGVRLDLSDSGTTLTDRISVIREGLGPVDSALTLFNNLLIRAGYLDSLSGHYNRRFQFRCMKIFAVDVTFPKLTRSNVSTEVRDVRYILDLDMIDRPDIAIESVLQQLGVL